MTDKKTQIIIRYIFVSVCAWVLVQETSGLVSAEEPESVFSMTHAVEQAILSGDYHRAERIADEFRANNPDEPAGPLMRASILQYEAVDYDDFSQKREFEDWISETERLADTRLEKNDRDQWARYYRASAEGLHAAFENLSGSRFSAMRKGRSSAALTGRIIEADADFHDAYLLHGSYLFWKSVALKRISWLPFIDDDQKRGIAEIEQAVGRGLMFGPLSNTVLMDVLLTCDPERARVLGEELIIEYPSCRLFAWQLGEAYKQLGRMADARVVFTRIAVRMRNDPADDGSGELRCWWKLAVLAHDTGDDTLCREYGTLVLAFENQPEVARRQHARIEQARQLMKECR